MPSEPVENCDQIKQAVTKEQQAERPDEGERRYLIKRSVELGCTEHIPDDWGIS